MARNTKKKKTGDSPILATNRKAGHDFHLLRRIEAGIVLTGPEVKTAREGRVNLKESYVRIHEGEVWLVGAHFSPYSHARVDDNEPTRKRKLLLHRAEIRKLEKEVDHDGQTIVPTKMYLKTGRIKVEIATAKGKKQFDKRDAAKKKEMQRDIERAHAASRRD